MGFLAHICHIFFISHIDDVWKSERMKVHSSSESGVCRPLWFVHHLTFTLFFLLKGGAWMENQGFCADFYTNY